VNPAKGGVVVTRHIKIADWEQPRSRGMAGCYLTIGPESLRQARLSGIQEVWRGGGMGMGGKDIITDSGGVMNRFV